MNIPIVFEDDYLLVVDKPIGVAVNRSENEKRETLQDWADDKIKDQRSKIKDQENDFYRRAGIVHRLDKDTSGLLIIAKNPSVFLKLQQLFALHEVDKKYYALVHGKVTSRDGEINLPVGRLPWNRRKFGVIPEGRTAVTRYKVLEHYEEYSFLDINPLTGRTHQIRIHFKSLGHSLVGDRLYAGNKVYEKDMSFCERLFLQAYFLSFIHPETGKKVEYKIELDRELRKVLSKLKCQI